MSMQYVDGKERLDVALRCRSCMASQVDALEADAKVRDACAAVTCRGCNRLGTMKLAGKVVP